MLVPGPPASEPGATAATSAGAEQLRAGIDAAAGELRTMVHAVLPQPLSERGLWAAVEDLADRMPVPTRLHLEPGAAALPPVVETTAYFVVAEALTNAVKHSAASHLEVRLTHTDGLLVGTVCDDGVGGAAMGAGSGLRGLADRLEALGGRLDVDSPAGGGTRVVAELPCGS